MTPLYIGSLSTRTSSTASAVPKDPITCTFPSTLSISFLTSASTSITCHIIHIKLSKSFSSSSSASAKYSPSP
ncbi:methionine aminopeptidase, type II [Aspergillus niger]|uniref:Methionine aminopeptidase, type II n=1 Tax=Aspergillus niger TaxID=5061 RepID=A0A505IHH9_ASPNG|nr:methionine aminopeptidase, type II [Aspergillus niger]